MNPENIHQSYSYCAFYISVDVVTLRLCRTNFAHVYRKYISLICNSFIFMKAKTLRPSWLLNLEIVCFVRDLTKENVQYFRQRFVSLETALWVRNFFAVSHVLIAVGFDDKANKYLLLARLPRCTLWSCNTSYLIYWMSNQFQEKKGLAKFLHYFQDSVFLVLKL